MSSSLLITLGDASKHFQDQTSLPDARPTGSHPDNNPHAGTEGAENQQQFSEDYPHWGDE